MTTALWSIGLVVIASIIGAFGALFLKKSSEKFRLSITGILKNKNLIEGVFFYGLATVLFIPALKGGDLSVLYPLVSLTYVWISILSVIYLNESFNNKKFLGMALIMLGVSLIGVGS